MTEVFLLEHEATLRLGVFAFVLLLMILWEHLAARRRYRVSRARRWLLNAAIVVVDTAGLRVAALLAGSGLAMGMALWAREAGYGLLPAAGMPWWAQAATGMVLLDMAIYGQHVALHKIPPLWRLHKLHHTDLDLDVSTALRFHPLEILLSMGLKMLLAMVLAPPVLTILLFETVLNGMAMFNHGNVRMPRRLDAALRLLVVTPDMHRVHHSVIPQETDSNYGFNLSC
jgi:sterol desaturase/sphingolipid hydroxylase (fatty acid hydroxylase superfamily)